MFAKSVGRAARSTPSIPNTCPRALPVPRVIASKHLKRHQRRLSSSKTSCPPDGPKAPSQAASNTSPAASEDKENSERESAAASSSNNGKRRSKQGVQSNAEAKARHEAFVNLPAVPPTVHLQRPDVHLSSLFALHRPISVTSSLPPSSSQASFASIFDPARPPSRRSNTMYTVSPKGFASAQNASNDEKDLRWEILQQSSSHSQESPSMVHLDGSPATSETLDQLVRQFRPFNTPPAPVPFDEQRETQRQSSEKQRQQFNEATRKTFTTTLTIDETTSPAGRKTYTASATPIVEASKRDNGPLPQVVRQPFLDRMRAREQRQADDAEARADVALQRQEALEYGESQENEGITDPREAREWLLISVKRQRKLKMKKHKYKKLMRRTRNLRRREGRN